MKYFIKHEIFIFGNSIDLHQRDLSDHFSNTMTNSRHLSQWGNEGRMH